MKLYLYMYIVICSYGVYLAKYVTGPAKTNQVSWHTKFDHVFQVYCIITFYSVTLTYSHP